MRYYAIIVGGGSGSRMQSTIPKQFLLLSGKPVIMHTIEAFYTSSIKPQIILAIPADYHEHWQELCITHSFHIPHLLVTGGRTRFHSVKNALNEIHANIEAIIAVHDAVRPLVSGQLIENSYTEAEKNGNAIAAVQSRDSVRSLKNNSSESLNRSQVYLVQTPQTFRVDKLKKAYEQAYDDKFTDDAAVVEQSGIKINLIEGSHTNIKITYPEDIAIAEALLKVATVNGS